MNILAFDTSQTKTYLALSKNEEIVDSKIINNQGEKYHSAFLIPNIVDILKKNGLTPENINVIATNVGPGSFTGIRACNTVARVFAQALDLKTVGVSSLEIFSRLSVNQNKVICLMDARKEQVYSAIYENKICTSQPSLLFSNELEDKLKQNDFTILADKKIFNFLNEREIKSQNYENSDKNLAEILVEIAIEKTKKNKTEHWQSLKPLYIQPPPISMPKVIK